MNAKRRSTTWALPRRLEAVLGMVRPGSKLVDIGTDHGLLPIAALRSDRVSSAIAVDARHAPAAVARENARRAGVELDVRVGDGLEPVLDGEADTGVMAGVGARTIVRVVANATARGVRRWIVQPNKEPERVRCDLVGAGFRLVDERVVADAGRFFVVLALEHDPAAEALSPADIEVGPILRARGGEVFARFADHCARWRRAELEGLVRSGRTSATKSEKVQFWRDAAASARLMVSGQAMPTLRPISAIETRPLRQRVLRPTQAAEELAYPGDDDPRALHVGAFEGDALIGIASVYPQGEDGTPSEREWRLRGMAVAPAYQGTGVGRALLANVLAHCRSEGGERFWCNARVAAVGFYEREGLVSVGEPFDIPSIGPHYVMERPL